MPISIIDFCDQHRACAAGRDWALAQGVTTMRDLWRLDMRPEWRIWIATRPGVMSQRDARLFAIWCATCTPLGNGTVIGSLLTDPRSRHAIGVAIARALGCAMGDVLREASRGAYVAAYVAYDAANAAAYASAHAANAANAAAYASAAADAAVAAADVAYAAAAVAGAGAGARKAQAQRLLTLLPEFP